MKQTEDLFEFGTEGKEYAAVINNHILSLKGVENKTLSEIYAYVRRLAEDFRQNVTLYETTFGYKYVCTMTYIKGTEVK